MFLCHASTGNKLSSPHPHAIHRWEGSPLLALVCGVTVDVVCGKFTSKRLERGREVGVWRGGKVGFAIRGGRGGEIRGKPWMLLCMLLLCFGVGEIYGTLFVHRAQYTL